MLDETPCYIVVKTICDECKNKVKAKFKISEIFGLNKGTSIHGICKNCGKLPISLETIPMEKTEEEK